MKKVLLAWLITCFFGTASFSQYSSTLPADAWVDSVFQSLTPDEKIAQLMIIRAHSNLGADHVAQVSNLVKNYNVGALIFFQGGPVRQANLTNLYQSLAKTPLLVSIDGEYGLGMRLDSMIKFPYQLTLGALTDSTLVYDMGLAVGAQMKRLGIHINYAPTIDINNNPRNPVIGYRSFGEDKYKVARMGVAYMKGMQDAGIMACAKHFPGHGDTEVDSHLDLPVINKSLEQLDTLELYPFKRLIAAGVGSIMNAHLYIPAIDNTPNRATSLSEKNVTGLLKQKLGYKGLIMTDALEMKGVSKFFPAGEVAVQALVAGNDMLCLPDNVNQALEAVKKAVADGRLKAEDIDEKVKKVLYAKYQLGLNRQQVVDTAHLVDDLNADTRDIIAQVARNSFTVLRNSWNFFPFYKKEKVAYVGLGVSEPNTFATRLLQDYDADMFLFSYRDADSSARSILQQIDSGGYSSVVIGVHDYSIRPANNYGISPAAIRLWEGLQKNRSVTFLFGNIYAARNFDSAKTLVAMHQDDTLTQNVAVGFISGEATAKGKAPVTVGDFHYGTGLTMRNLHPVTGSYWLGIDSIVYDAMRRKVFPGCVVLAAQNGRIKYHKAFGRYEFDTASLPVHLESIYDLASVTKTSATTLAVMKLYEQGKLDLDKTLGDYLPWTLNSDKAALKIRDILLHQAGLVATTSFSRETVDKKTTAPLAKYYSTSLQPGYSVPVARDIYLRNDWNDSMLQRIVKSPLRPQGQYVYSDNDFILLGKIVESLSGLPLDKYMEKNFYGRIGLATTGFNPWLRFGTERVVPTQMETHFRHQMLRGYVHDEGAALFGGVAGHAGLFSDAFDLWLLYQMLLNGGQLNGIRYLKPETISYFTAYHSSISRRGLGFDKPEKDNAKRRSPYPSIFASPDTYGHTGFTGTCVWVDPQSKLVYIFLSNRVYNTKDDNLLSELNIRGKIQDVIYKALKREEAELVNTPLPPAPSAAAR
ncbi:glycoside hydrolase family 3 N-terminal domain-containing protein [Paraflavisolibacter sp. H34]|uniref:glycoside hydrolase family 3 N-terminal domain-containing protein n=1 Tax=Huijunlia imazamoxiresistens TaxID=3127457 RepID=UPI003019C8E4